MLAKLTKHELYATGRIFLPLYSIMLLLSLINRGFSSIGELSSPFKTLKGFMVAAYVISIVATLVITFVIIILRFYKNLMSDEGYLMFTLPVKPSQLINAKLIVSFLWNILSIFVVATSLFIILGTSKNLEMFRGLLDLAVTGLKSTFGSSYPILIAEYIIMIFVGTIYQILMIYVSIAIGHLLNEHKVIGSFAAYIAINTIIQMLVSIIVLIWTNLELSIFTYTPYYGTTETITGNNVNYSVSIVQAITKQIIPFSIIFSVLCCVAFYIVKNYIFKKKLNLN